MFGSHLSIAGTMLNALTEAQTLGLDTVQVFTKNQQQWKAKPLDPGMVRDWQSRIGELGWQDRTVSHASYLINLASPADELWQKSVDLMTDEIERCEQLGIPFLVHHPGAHTTDTREAGLARIAKAYAELFKRTKGYRTVCCLENTVGSGSNIGREFEELAALRSLIIGTTGQPDRVGFCFDTCHAHAGGYDLSAAKGVAECFDQWERTCGLEHLRVFHMNDSKAPAGSRRDRHEHIGRGTIGAAGFAAMMAQPVLRDRPKIMETPKDGDCDGTPWDTVNLLALKGAGSPSASPATVGAGPRKAATVAKSRTPVEPGVKPARKPSAAKGSGTSPRGKPTKRSKS